MAISRQGPPNRGLDAAGVKSLFSTNVLEMIQDRAIVTVADYKPYVSDGAIFNDLERPLTQISRSCQVTP